MPRLQTEDSALPASPEFGLGDWARQMFRDGRSIIGAILTNDPMGRYYRHLQHLNEGFIMPQQARILRDIVRIFDVKTVAEIGFNGGHSAFNFLVSDPEVVVTSFELRDDAQIAKSKAKIDEMHPGRHELIIGDSKATLLAAAALNKTYDLVFIDGDHSLEGASADITSSRRLANQHNGTIVVMDDLDPTKPWGVGPTIAWESAVSDESIDQLAIFRTNDDRVFGVGTLNAAS